MQYFMRYFEHALSKYLYITGSHLGAQLTKYYMTILR